MRTGAGFIAALDQSGGSTPKALSLYGIPESAYPDEEEMCNLIHQMRTRIILSNAFKSERILAAILFEMTMERSVEGLPTAEYLWHRKGIVPFLKIDNGLLPPEHGVALMKPMPQLSAVLAKANHYGIFGTKARSVIRESNAIGISSCVDQQFEIAEQVLEADLIPIIEPEVDIESHEKQWIEYLLKSSLLQALDALDGSQNVILKLTIPSEENYYAELVDHPRVIRVAALSGGYSQAHANDLLLHNRDVIASFSRALTEGLNCHQSEEEFEATLDRSVEAIFKASTNKI
jgi:fructose-bisphosphate aldolase class I